MSTTTQEHETTMPPQTKEHQLYQSIRQYELEDWLEPIPGGFRTIRLLPDWKIALLLIKLSAVLFTLLKAYSELDSRDSGWFTLLTVVCVAGVAFAFIFGLSRKVVFDLENDEVSVTLLGSPVSRKRLQDLTTLSYQYGSTFYVEFKDLSKIRIADIRNKKELENLEQFILEAMAAGGRRFADKNDRTFD